MDKSTPFGRSSILISSLLFSTHLISSQLNSTQLTRHKRNRMITIKFPSPTLTLFPCGYPDSLPALLPWMLFVCRHTKNNPIHPSIHPYLFPSEKRRVEEKKKVGATFSPQAPCKEERTGKRQVVAEREKVQPKTFDSSSRPPSTH